MRIAVVEYAWTYPVTELEEDDEDAALAELADATALGFERSCPVMADSADDPKETIRAGWPPTASKSWRYCALIPTSLAGRQA